MKAIKIILYILLLASFLFMRCTPEQRFARLVKNNPGLIKADSTAEGDTLVKPGAKTKYKFSQDNLNNSSKEKPLANDSAGVKTVIYKEGETIYLNTECPPDTVIKNFYYQTKWYPLPPEKPKKEPWYSIFYPFLYALAGVVFTFIVLGIQRIANPHLIKWYQKKNL